MEESTKLEFKKRMLEGRKKQFLELMKFIIPAITFLIAAFGSEKWVLAYGFFVIIFGLIVISEQIEKLIKQ